MPMLLDPKNDPVQPMVYEVKVKGHLGPQWTDWFEGLTITLEGDGYTLLTGPVVDQAAMHALLRKVRDLGITLISVNQVEAKQTDSIDIKDRDEVNDADRHLEDGSAQTTWKSVRHKVNWRRLMKAIVFTEFGPPEVLQLAEVEKPTPKNDEVLIKVHASTVTSGDYTTRSSPASVRIMATLAGVNIGLRRPNNTILGVEFAGEIDAVGKDVTSYKIGDQVYGDTGSGYGANAEYVCMPEDGALALMPVNMTYDEAAAVPRGAKTALHFLRDKGNIQQGQRILIYGASGSVGTYAVQLAKYYGAEVTAVCSTPNLELVQSLGADRVIDYTKEDFTKNGETYDIIYDTVGKCSISHGKSSLKENGIYLVGAGGMSAMVQVAWTSIGGSKKVIFGIAPEHKEDLLFLKELIEAGKLDAVIDRTYPLEQTAEAHRYADKGHKKGNVVITVNNRSKS